MVDPLVERRPLWRNRRLLLVALGAVALVVVVVVVVVVIASGGGKPSAEKAIDEISEVLVNAEEEAQASEAGRFDAKALAARLQVEGFLIELDASSDRRRVGVAARKLDEPLCVFVWTKVGGPRAAVVTDPRLPCDPAIALVAAGSPF